MKITAVCKDLDSNAIVRPASFLQILSKHFDVEVIGYLTGEIFGPYKDLLDYNPVRVETKWTRISPTLVSRMKRLYSKIDGDLIYVFDYDMPHFLPSVISKKMKKKPLIIDIVDYSSSLFTSNYPLSPDFKLYYHLMEKMIKMADEITVPTHFLQNKFGGIWLPTGVDIHLFDPEKYTGSIFRAEAGIKEDDIVVMFTGTPQNHKGVIELIDAVSEAKKEVENLRLVFVGGDPKSEYLKSLKKRAGGGAVFKGYVPHDKMPNVLASADIIAIPQRDEPYAKAQIPAKLFDAMAMAKTIIATQVSDMDLILGNDAGFLVSPNDTKSLEEKVIYVTENLEEAEKIGKNARKICIEKYSYEVIERPLLKLVKDLM